MRSTTILSGLGALFASAVLAAPFSGSSDMSPRQTCEFDSANSPSCWGDYSLSTNWYDEGPDTGVTREYWFEIQSATVSPDGVERIGLVINGTVPGPTIYADWGDTVSKYSLYNNNNSTRKPASNLYIVVHFTNAMADNGTSIHFHGIRQK
jgi:FtsP/CotA-like multicopper oxidase with cupredoxin domain